MSETVKQILLIASFGVFGLGSFYVLYNYFEMFTQFGASILIVAIATSLFYLVDKYLLSGFDTLNELKNNNISVGLALIAYSIIIGFSLLAAFR